MKKKRDRRPFILPLLALPFLAASLLSGCGTNPPRQTQQPEVLRLLYWQAPTILNPHLSIGFKDWEASRITLEPLATFNNQGDLIPVLAAEVPTVENGGVAADGLSVTWKLKPDIQWSDGTPFTAADVVFTYEFISNPETASGNSSNYDAIASVEAVDPLTVKVNFKAVTPGWFLPFVGSEGMILPQHIFADYTGANSRQAPGNLLPVGTGPYRVVEFRPGDTVVYEANPYFREAETLYFQRIELKGGGDSTSAARAVLQTGDADYAYGLQVEPQVLEQLEAGGQGQVMAIFGPLSERIQLNQTDPNSATAAGDRSSLEFPHPFLSDRQVRQAFNLAIDRDTISQQLYGVTGTPTPNFLVSPETYLSPNTQYEFNLEKAATLLEQAGWRDTNNNGIRDKNGAEMRVLFQTSVNPVRQKTQEIIKQNFRTIGVEMEIKSIDASIFFSGDPSNTDSLNRFYADLQMVTTGNTSPDPTRYLQTFTCGEIARPENSWSGSNTSRYCNPEYDKFWQRSTTELNPKTRGELFIQMNDLLVKDVAVIPLVHRADAIAVSNNLEGVELTSWDRVVWNIHQWRRK
ncbi:peptide ABC transporter substrate-binding protein [Laspinema sp. A4]|uniref:peptide ABC transporter substrate-binding protein n=1 Tax=Laspinema sp. D2d TaxID=2953686 RepID=UPI0021BAEDDA|nr:peptide ABC transporter substrate-binding protein [Laspinema sp. D2d]MCT7982247.1 peptide ABC transporter substrate-binding protein [Laspinema sp. D2d]